MYAASLLLQNRVGPSQDVRESRHVGVKAEMNPSLRNPGRLLRYHTARDVAGPNLE